LYILSLKDYVNASREILRNPYVNFGGGYGRQDTGLSKLTICFSVLVESRKISAVENWSRSLGNVVLLSRRYNSTFPKVTVSEVTNSFISILVDSPALPEAEWTPFQTHYFSENVVAPGIENGISGSVARDT
jgi:hypothetical protein